MNEIVKKYIILSVIPGLGPVSQNRILKLCGDIQSCFSTEEETILRMDAAVDRDHRVGKSRIKSLVEHRGDAKVINEAERIVESCSTKGISVITAEDSRYPKRFCNLPDMPIVLYGLGNLKINEYARSIGVVGARRCQTEGKESSIEITKTELSKGAAVISGMAKGIDSYAHTAAIMNEGYTIAVLGNGPDICYPKEHEKLYAEIIKHGCILSEYPPGTFPQRYMFPQRNSLIAALSDQLYVINAGRNSGTESTVKAADRYGRRIALL